MADFDDLSVFDKEPARPVIMMSDFESVDNANGPRRSSQPARTDKDDSLRQPITSGGDHV
jgi:hypothetical protein